MCILTRQEAIPALRNVIVALITSTIRGIPTEVHLTTGDGMPTECAISLDNLRTVPQATLTKRIATLGPDRMHEVCRALTASTAC